ncbi:MAG: cellulase family glycosylhydrolase [Planctomycetes bacterium]|nr:cellulase family glycosylhydrolase [Planctomycetota bacterium]
MSTPDTRVNLGITVMGMRDAVVTRNTQSFTLVDGNPVQEAGKCSLHNVVVGSEDAASLTSDLVGIAVDDSVSGCVTGVPSAPGMETIGIAADGSTLVGVESGRTFIPFGMSFSSPRGGPLVEQRWEDDMEDVVADLRELKRMGATFTRVRLQFRTFIDPPSAGYPNGTPNPVTFANLAKFTRLAAQTGLYLSFSGLRIQRDLHADDWYSDATQEERWSAQETYWSEIAKTVGASTSVAWYDMMNEPIVPTEEVMETEDSSGWCPPGGALGGNCFVQYITRTPNGAPAEIAQEWMHRLADAITAERDFHLITIGAAGLVSDQGVAFPCFGPFGTLQADDARDFLSIHVYPRMKTVMGVPLGKPTIDDWIQAVKSCKSVDHPMIISEVSNFGVGALDVGDFILGSWPEAAGWSGHYYSHTPEQIHVVLADNYTPGVPFRDQTAAFKTAAIDRAMYREWMAVSTFRTKLMGGGTVQP